MVVSHPFVLENSICTPFVKCGLVKKIIPSGMDSGLQLTMKAFLWVVMTFLLIHDILVDSSVTMENDLFIVGS